MACPQVKRHQVLHLKLLRKKRVTCIFLYFATSLTDLFIYLFSGHALKLAKRYKKPQKQLSAKSILSLATEKNPTSKHALLNCTKEIQIKI